MAIVAADLKGFLSLNMPENNTGTSGGGIDTAGKFTMTQMAANDTVECASSSTESITVTVEGRNAAGAIVSEGINITTADTFVAGTITFERILKVTAPAHAGTITVRRVTGAVLICTLEDAAVQGFVADITKVIALFYDAASEAGAIDVSEKVFMRNDHATLTLNNALLSQTSDPSGLLSIGVAVSKGDSNSIGNRKTAIPAGHMTAAGLIAATGTTEPVPTNTLASAENIGIWIQMALGASQAGVRDVYDVKLEGTSV